MIRRLVHLIEESIWPRKVKCLCCDSYSEGEWLCPACSKALEAMKLSPDMSNAENAQCVYQYDGVAKQLVLLIKEECVADAAYPLAQGMADVIGSMKLPSDTVLTWVTMPEMRRKKRGIDHGRVLCQTVAMKTGLPVRQLLKRTKQVHTQRGLGQEARLQNLTGTVLCDGIIKSPVLLIDDVMTTGATAAICSAVLKAAGAPEVYVLTATRAMLRATKR